MAFYLVSAAPRQGSMEELSRRLSGDEFSQMKPFGRTLTHSLKHARIRWDGVAVWEEEDYCRPPLAQERAAVLDEYFSTSGSPQSKKARDGSGSRTCHAFFPNLMNSRRRSRWCASAAGIHNRP